MIILNDEEQAPKQAPELTSDTDTLRVTRSSTPTPSLPDYDTSEAQQKRNENESNWKRRRRSKFWRAALCALVAYFTITVAVGVPLIVYKVRKSHNLSSPNAYFPLPSTWGGPKDDEWPLPDIDIGDGPLLMKTATQCNTWKFRDRKVENGLLNAQLTYTIPVDDGIFVRSNISTVAADPPLDAVKGSLTVDVNDDPDHTDAEVTVSLTYTTDDLRQRIDVCLLNVTNGNGVYIAVPEDYAQDDILDFQITLLLPQTALNSTLPPLIPSFVTMLPQFPQHLGSLSPRVTFGNVVLGGLRSDVSVDSIHVVGLFVKSSFGDIRGSFNATDAVVLDTVSAPIQADIILANLGGHNKKPSTLILNTGNSLIDANVTLVGPSSDSMPFYIKAETFNAPLNLSIAHAATTAPSQLHVHAVNNLGTAELSLDRYFMGSFVAQTKFATAIVEMNGTRPGHGPGPNNNNQSNNHPGPGPDSSPQNGPPPGASGDGSMGTSLPPKSTPSITGGGNGSVRHVEYDVVENERVSGWVGDGNRPQLRQKHGHHGPMISVQVESALSPVLLRMVS